MRELPLNALRAFAAVYETGGVRPAARALAVTHSSISRHLRALEAWLGRPLIAARSGVRALAFTREGEALGRAASASLGGLARAVAELRETRRGNGVTIATTPSFAARWLLPRLAGFAAAHPWIELSVVAEQRATDPSAQGADLAIRMGRGPWTGLRSEPFMDDVLYPVMSRGYWQKSGRPRTPAALARLRLLHDRDPEASWEAWRRAHPAGRLDVRAGPRFASSDLVLRAAGQGLGVALARGRLAADDVAAGTLMRPLGDLSVDVRDAYWIVRPATAPRRAAVTATIAWLKAQAKGARAPAGARKSRRRAGG